MTIPSGAGCRGPGASSPGPPGPVARFARRRPFLGCFLLLTGCNAVGSGFNFVYNKFLIIDGLTPAQAAAFWEVLAPAYNLLAYPACLALTVYWMWPLGRCWRDLHGARAPAPERLERCRRRVVNLPAYLVCLNLLGWLPGAVVFPLGVCAIGGWRHAPSVGALFGVSFVVAALVTSVQTFFLVEAWLVRTVYPDFFRDARPAEVRDTIRLRLGPRLVLYWVASTVVPVLALTAVVLSFAPESAARFGTLRLLFLGVAGGGFLTSGLMAWMVGHNLVAWVREHGRATEQIKRGRYAYRIAEKRPDEFGGLSDRFNDMAAELGRAEEVRETFGQFLGPEVRDEILRNDRGLEGDLAEITVLFADIRGFTKRSQGEAPGRVVALLNRFLSLAVPAVEEQGGWVNKFLGDGFMALFGTPRPRAHHADLAVQAAEDLLRRLGGLNRELAGQGQPPLAVGIGIHTGPALVGCIGASLVAGDGRPCFRREFTAIGETVNLCQRLEQMTKTHGGPVLLSGQTRARLRREPALTCLGTQDIPNADRTLVVFRLGAQPAVCEPEAGAECS